jgi:2-oxoisovalerate dehydrogenase E1 component subunit alpha
VGTASEPANPPSTGPTAARDLPPHKLLALYHTMHVARAIERRVWLLNKQDQSPRSAGAPTPSAREWPQRRMGGPIHHDVLRVGGSEAVQVAAAAALRPGFDWVVPYHRDLALCLAMGVSPLDVMLALFGRADDPSSGGRQAPVSFGSRQARIASSSGAIGTQVVHAAGIAYASKLREKDEVTLVSIGDRGTDTGDWHEGINFAAVHRLPMICIVQDDPPRSRALTGQHAADLILMRAQGYGIAGDRLDGADFSAAFSVLCRAVERARSGEGPTLIRARVPDLSSVSARGTIKPPEQLEAMARQDPIERMRRELQDLGLLDDYADDRVQRDCITVVEAAVDQARMAPSPEPRQALDNVFGGHA